MTHRCHHYGLNIDKRAYQFIDTPGHCKYSKHVVRALANADAAIVVINYSFFRYCNGPFEKPISGYFDPIAKEELLSDQNEVVNE